MAPHSHTRVRFAPSPTGFMHIGNIRTALFNYLFARQKNGTFILRIEDTDAKRNFDPRAQKIIADLHWLNLSYDEGPNKEKGNAPYFQSLRLNLYQDYLNKLIKIGRAYRCFCSEEELSKKRDRQRSLKLPPRYDRTCLTLSSDEITQHTNANIPFVWRFKLDHDKSITITDLAKGKVTFELKNFSDFPLTRSDGTFTFMFANCVDDIVMKITDIFRGEDHLSNTAGQAALYETLHVPLPIFWHMPIICSPNGKKLSKRDFGFSLHDLQQAGFLPQAINNYLAIIGGSYENEIMNLEELTQIYDFNNPSSASKIKYDVEKLRWINHQWINQLAPEKLAELTRPFLAAKYPTATLIETHNLAAMIQHIKTDLYTLKEATTALHFYFEQPSLNQLSFESCISLLFIEKIIAMIQKQLHFIEKPEEFLNSLKSEAKILQIPIKELFWFLRIALSGKINGPSINDLIAILGVENSKKRLQSALELF